MARVKRWALKEFGGFRKFAISHNEWLRKGWREAINYNPNIKIDSKSLGEGNVEVIDDNSQIPVGEIIGELSKGFYIPSNCVYDVVEFLRDSRYVMPEKVYSNMAPVIIGEDMHDFPEGIEAILNGESMDYWIGHFERMGRAKVISSNPPGMEGTEISSFRYYFLRRVWGEYDLLVGNEMKALDEVDTHIMDIAA